MKRVVLPWLSGLSLKQQTVLLTALRGCDGVPKEDISKKFVRVYRSLILKNAEEGFDRDIDHHFMKEQITDSDVTEFLGHLDHYYMHWLTHFIYAIEIVGYNHPVSTIRQWWSCLYLGLVSAIHLSPESKEDNDYRLRDKIY